MDLFLTMDPTQLLSVLPEVPEATHVEDWSRIQKTTPLPSQLSSARFSRTSGRPGPDPAAVRDHSVSEASASNPGRFLITEVSEQGDDEEDPEGVTREETDVTGLRRRSLDLIPSESEAESESELGDSLPPPPGEVDIDNPEGYDTDLEIDDKEFLNGSPNEFDATGIKDYIRECNALGVIPVSFFQRHVTDKVFIMRHHGLGPLGAKAIAKPLEGNTHIEHLDLEGNCIGGEGAQHLAAVLRENCYISRLMLANNGLASEGLRAVCKMMSENTTITDCNLAANGLKDSDGEEIHRLIEKSKSLHVLDLNNNRLECGSAKWIRDAMVNNVSLRFLDLSWNGFRLRSAQLFAEMIQENYGLKCLNLAMNGFGDEGAVMLGKALTQNQCLEEINLQQNRISDSGARGIAKGLELNDTLRILRLGHNPITSEGSLPLLAALYRNDNTSLSTLDISNIVVTDEFEKLHKEQVNGEKARNLSVTHGGVLFRKKHAFSLSNDREMAFHNDPMTKFKRIAEKHHLRLIDLLRQLDKDNSMTLTHEELKDGIKLTGIEMNEEDIDKLIEKLDTDHDGEIDYSELIAADMANRESKRNMIRWKQEEAKRAGQKKDVASSMEKMLAEDQ